ncbi:MAG: winged helix DNA-binding domain-containing protein [Candidatus Limnocylindrales bacterium]
MTLPPERARLDRRTLNRTVLARQHLLGRVALPLPAAIEQLIGLQAQVPRDPYISLWSRLRDFRPGDLERLLLERQAVRMTLMRTTLHLVTAADVRGLRAVMQDVCERGFRSSPFRRQLDGVELDELRAVGAAICGEHPRTMPELGRLLGERWPTHDRTALAYAVRYLVPVVQVTPRGLLRRSGVPRVTTLDAWLGRPGDGGPVVPDPDEVVLRYLRAFGPATVADIRTWSWLTGLKPLVERLRPRLRSYRDAAGRELLDVADGTIMAGDVPAPVRFLGEFDNAFLSHADRSHITGDDAWGAAYLRRGAFFVDGFLAGAWRASEVEGRAVIAVEPRTPMGTARDEVAAEADALLQFLRPDATIHHVEYVDR